MPIKDNIVSLTGVRNSSLSPQVKAIVADSRAVIGQTLPVLVEGLFEQLDDAMYHLAEKSGSDALQTSYFHTMRELRKAKDAISTRFASQVLLHFDRFWSSGGTAQRSTSSGFAESGGLELVGEAQLEESLAISNIISKAENRYHRELFALNHRYSHLTGTDELTSVDNPIGPAVLSNTFQEAISVLDADVPMKLVIFKLFDRHVIAYVGGLYDELNDLLQKAGVLPKLNPMIKRNPVAPAVEKHRRVEEAEAPDDDGEVDQAQTRLFNSLTELLAAQRAGMPASGSLGSVRHVDQSELLAALNAVQQSVSSGQLLRSPEEVKAQLGEQLGLDPAAVGVHSLGTADADTLDVISMLFDFLVEDRNLPDAMKVLLGRLQIPMLKAAILDRSFFSKRHHPARLLLNELAQAAVGWSDDGERGPDSLYGRMEAAVERVTEGFDTDIKLFTEVEEEFRAFFKRESHGAELVEKRVCRVNEGKEQLAQARKAVNALMRDKLMMREGVPVVVRNMLRDAWKDVMVLVYLKNGPDSAKWDATASLVDQLLWSVEPKHEPQDRKQLLDAIPSLLKGLREGLNEISFDQHRIARLFKELQECHVACLKARAVETLPIDQVREDVVDEDTLIVEEPSDDIEESARQQAESLEVGTWVEFRDGDGESKRLKLSWKSRVSNNCLFVNRKGVKALELTLQELAQAFQDGSVTVLAEAGKPLMDRAMNAMLSTLKKHTGGGASA